MLVSVSVSVKVVESGCGVVGLEGGSGVGMWEGRGIGLFITDYSCFVAWRWDGIGVGEGKQGLMISAGGTFWSRGIIFGWSTWVPLDESTRLRIPVWE